MRLRTFAWIIAFVASLPVTAAAHERDPLVGAWIVERFVDRPEGGAARHLFGEQPRGLFVFTPDGHFSFSIMHEAADKAGAGNGAGDGAAAWTPGWYVSYFGTYRYDPAGPSWTARVTGANIPGYVGTEQTRSFRIDGDRLTITVASEENGRTVHGERVLRRAGPDQNSRVSR